VKVKILEIDSERRRLSLSVKRVEGQVLEPKALPPEEAVAAPQDGLDDAGETDDLPEPGRSEEASGLGDAAPAAPVAEAEFEPLAEAEPAAELEPAADPERAAEAGPDADADPPVKSS